VTFIVLKVVIVTLKSLETDPLFLPKYVNTFCLQPRSSSGYAFSPFHAKAVHILKESGRDNFLSISETQ
jgi:hypothetical protein